MRRSFLYARRTLALLLVLFVVWVVGLFIYDLLKTPAGWVVLLLLAVFLALLGGLAFLFSALFRGFGGLIRFIARPVKPWRPLGRARGRVRGDDPRSTKRARLATAPFW